MAEFKGRYRAGEVQKILLKSGKVINCCCPNLIITYDWAGTNLYDLDTSTRTSWRTLSEESHGYECANQRFYMDWQTNDNQEINGKEVVVVNVSKAFQDDEWPNPSSINIDLYAWWYPTGSLGGGNVKITASYGNQQAEKQVYIDARRTQEDDAEYISCSPNKVATLSFSKDEMSIS
jgi:hypothetical protein